MRIGLVGAGKMGSLRAQSIKEAPGASLAAVFDIARPLAEAAAAGTDALISTELEAFLELPMDAVIISTPPHLHEQVAIPSLARGRHVLCEKPLSNDVGAAKRIVDGALAADRALATGFNMRYYPFVKFVREAVDSGKIGDIDHIRVYGGHDGLHNFGADWQYKMPHSGGGAMMDVGIHMSDLARYFLGEVVTVGGVMSEKVFNLPGSEDNAMAVYTSPEGIAATYHATWTDWKGYSTRVEVYGSRGMAMGSYAPMYNLLIEKDGPVGAPRRTERRYPEIMVREKLQSWKSTALATYREELADFLKMCNGEGNVTLADGYAGLRAIELAAAVRKSTATGECVHLPALGRMPAITGRR